MSKKLLVLDLDETLIHAQDKHFPYATHNTFHYYLAVRPGLESFLDAIHLYYDLMIWSNNGQEYIDEIMDSFWPKHLPLVDIFTSNESSIKYENGYGIPFFKEIKKIAKRHGEYSKNQILAIDDKPQVHKRNYGNLIAISPFHGKPDSALDLLSTYLLSIKDVENVRSIEKRGWESRMKREQEGLSIY